MKLEDRIIRVLTMSECRCVWPARRAINRLWLDDRDIPESGFWLFWSLRKLQRQGDIFIKRGFVGLAEPINEME